MLAALAAEFAPADSQKFSAVTSSLFVPSVLPPVDGIAMGVVVYRVQVVDSVNACEPMPVTKPDGEPPVPNPCQSSTATLGVPTVARPQNDTVTVFPESLDTLSIG